MLCGVCTDVSELQVMACRWGWGERERKKRGTKVITAKGVGWMKGWKKEGRGRRKMESEQRKDKEKKFINLY